MAFFVATDMDQSDTENSRITYSIADISATPAIGASGDPVRILNFAVDLTSYVHGVSELPRPVILH